MCKNEGITTELKSFSVSTIIGECKRYECLHNDEHECNLKKISLNHNGGCTNFIIQNVSVYIPEDVKDQQ